MGSLKVTYNSSDIINLASAAGTKTLTTNSKFMTSDVAINYDLSGGSEPGWILLCSKDGPASSTWGMDITQTSSFTTKLRNAVFYGDGLTFHNGCTAYGTDGINIPTNLAPSDYRNGLKSGYSVQYKVICLTYRTDNNYSTLWNATLSQHIFRYVYWGYIAGGNLGLYGADMYIFDSHTEMPTDSDGTGFGYMYNYVGKGRSQTAYSSTVYPRMNVSGSVQPLYTSSVTSGKPTRISFDGNQYYYVQNGTKFKVATDWVKDPSIKFEVYMRYIKDGIAEEFMSNMKTVYPEFTLY